MKDRESLLADLNDEQREAVLNIGCDSLILAGAGAGKTRVLTTKIAYLLSQGTAPYQIMALTFTNKAAREMRQRIADIVGSELARYISMGTFHSIFARSIRSYADKLGYTNTFTIYDTTDSRSLIKIIIKDLNLETNIYKVPSIQSLISTAKNNGVSPTDLAEDMLSNPKSLFSKEYPQLPEIYKQYQLRCHLANAMDFDDLLLNMLTLLQRYDEVRALFHDRYRHILVDEYQDTNRVQHRIIQLLKGKQTELTVVGDDAQSIYAFRGAVIDNILNFSNTYPDSKLYKLTKNYRSTGNIVDLANGLIEKNEKRIPKSVEAVAGRGEKILLFEAFNAPMEAQQVAAQVYKLTLDGIDPEEIAVLYRTNAQSRLLEQNLKMFGVPNRIYGGLSFFDRKEVKDVLAYLRLVVNPFDDEAFRRVYNVPARGIGATTFEGLAEVADTEMLPLMTLVKTPEKIAHKVKPRGIQKLQEFVHLIDRITELTEELEPVPYLQKVIEMTGLKMLYNDGSVEGQSRIDNISELVTALNDYINRRKEEIGEEPSLEDFIQEMALYTDQDTEEDDTPKVTLMTMHASKGLEYSHIFCVGIEETLIPSMRSNYSQEEVEEERRLFYVAITRAKSNCTISFARERMVNGQTIPTGPSRFIKDLDPNYIKDTTGILKGSIKEQVAKKLERLQSDLPSPKKRITRIKRKKNPDTEVNQVVWQPFTDESDIKTGDIVYHNNFGRGEVLGFSDSISGTKVMVQFGDGQKRQLILKYAKLRKEQ